VAHGEGDRIPDHAMLAVDPDDYTSGYRCFATDDLPAVSDTAGR
jgi:hypothetical protein